MAELVRLISRRKAIRTRVTASYNKINLYDQMSPLQRNDERSRLMEYGENLIKLDVAIQDLKFQDIEKFKEEELDLETELCTDYRDKIKSSLCVLDSLSKVSVNVSQLDTARTLLKQPTAPLPTFSGKENEDLLRFLSEFELTSSSFNYPDRDLLLLLMQQVSGNAKTLLKSLEADKQTFKSAKELLITAFASEVKRKLNTISRLTELNLGYQDDPFDYISKVKNLHESVKTLNMKTDDFIQYFVWRGLNQSFQTHLTHITSETVPSLTSILDNFFDANERYQQTRKLAKSKNHQSLGVKTKEFSPTNSSSYAVKVTTKETKVSCSLCSSNDGH